MSADALVAGIRPLGFPWGTRDPFLFCVHHLDFYPPGNEALGPRASLAGRRIGMDFEGKDGWRMYHGDVVPGFPRHPHRGFETLTIARQGFIDHSDSLGATARFGSGDLQWVTAGEGVVHSEMFPLLDPEEPNTVELFQIWLNLPSDAKLTPPEFKMFWRSQIPRKTLEDAEGNPIEVVLYTGRLPGFDAPPAPPAGSWAARTESDVVVATITLAPGASYELPPAFQRRAARSLYYFSGEGLLVEDMPLERHCAIDVLADRPAPLKNPTDAPVELLLLQGVPIAEPVAHHGPFVMNDRAELQQAFLDYQRTGFGGWPWESDGPAHPRSVGRFAVHPDGREERPDSEG